MTRARDIAASPAVIFCAAIFTRLVATLFILEKYVSPQQLFVMNEPSHIAAAVVSGLGFSSPYANTPIVATAQQPPLYPFILAAIFKLFGTYTTQAAWAIVGLHILAGSLTAVLIYQLGKLHFGRTVGIVAAWIWVLPWMFQIRSFAVSLTNAYLAGLGFAAFLFWFSRLMNQDRGWFLFGIYSGLLLLLQTAFLPVFVVYGLKLAFSKQRTRMYLALAGLLFVLAPWTIRNYLAMGHFIPIRDNFGLELWLGNRPGMHGTLDYGRDFPSIDPSNYIRLGEVNFMRAKGLEAWHFILNHPGACLSRSLRRLVEFWYVPYPPSWIAFSVLGWIGAILAWKRCEAAWLFVTPMAVFPLVYYITHVYAAYRYPIQPVIVLLAAYSMVNLSAYLGHKWMPQVHPARSRGEPDFTLDPTAKSSR